MSPSWSGTPLELTLAEVEEGSGERELWECLLRLVPDRAEADNYEYVTAVTNFML